MFASLRPALGQRAHVLSRWMSTVPPPQGKEKELFNIVQNASMTGSAVDNQDPPPSHIKWRIFYKGNVVTPNELTPAKCAPAPRRSRWPTDPPPAPVARYNDMFRQLDLDPLQFALSPSVLYKYVSEIGKIYPRNVTGLTARSQRRLGKAIRRARMIGILPQFSRPNRQYIEAHLKRHNS